MLRPYRNLLAVPHLASLLTWSMLARVHATGLGIAVTFLVVEWTGSYGIAGLFIGAMAVGNGISGPWRGRAADREPASRLLTRTVLAYCGGLVVLLCLPGSWWPAGLVVMFLVGLCTPPAGPIGRSAYTRVASGEARSAAFAVEATGFELLFMLGPVAIAFVVGLVSPRAAIGVIALTALVCTLVFAAVLRRAGVDEPVCTAPAEPGARQTPVLAARGLGLALASSLFLVMAFGMLDLAVVAVGRELGSPTVAGVLIAVWAAGSLVGGLVSGGLRGQPRFALRTALVGVGMAALVPVLPPVLEPTSPVLIGLLLAVGGVFIAPTISAGNTRIGNLAPEGRTAEAFGWLATFTTTGNTIAAPIAGSLLDLYGPAAAAVGASVAMVVATVLAALSVRVVRTTRVSSSTADMG